MQDDLEAMAEGSGSIAVHAGFPNPAADKRQSGLSLDRLLIPHPASTYLFRIRSNNYEHVGIFDGDLALIDRSRQPQPNDLVVTWQADGFNLCRLRKLPDGVEPWGVITATVHDYRRNS